MSSHPHPLPLCVCHIHALENNVQKNHPRVSNPQCNLYNFSTVRSPNNEQKCNKANKLLLLRYKYCVAYAGASQFRNNNRKLKISAI